MSKERLSKEQVHAEGLVLIHLGQVHFQLSKLSTNLIQSHAHSQNILTSVDRIISQAHSTLSRQSSSQRSQSPASINTESRTQEDDSPPPYTPQTPSRRYQIYNDSLASSSQPQTPAQLPEERHRSRFHPSYTAPVTRASARVELRAVVGGVEPRSNRARPSRIITLQTPSRRAGHSRRVRSPPGLIGGGFHGLYGGRENSNEEQSWIEGVQMDHAETRLWGTRNASGQGRRFNRTPEQEDWRIRR